MINQSKNSEEFEEKKPHMVRTTALLNPSDYKCVHSILGDSCPDSTAARMATHLFIKMEKEQAQMGQLVVTLKKHDDPSTKNKKRVKVGLTPEEDEIVRRIAENVECSYSQVIRFAYCLFALDLKEKERPNDKKLENYQFLVDKHYEQHDEKSPRTRM